MKRYLVVYEDLWGNKYSIQTDKIGDTIKQICEDEELTIEDFDIDKYNSDSPYDSGTMGLGFYDVYFEQEDSGRIMIFTLKEE